MNKLELFRTTFWISLLGGLPPGVLNITVFKLTSGGMYYDIFLFLIPVLIVELIFVWLSTRFNLKPGKVVTTYGSLFFSLLLMTIGVQGIFAVTEKHTNDSLLIFALNPFVAGITLSLLNPFILPFWTVTTAYLQSKSLLDNSRVKVISYLIGVALGTLSSFVLIMLVALISREFFFFNLDVLNQFTAWLYLLLGFVILIRYVITHFHKKSFSI